jgi:hypothetical protein
MAAVDRSTVWRAGMLQALLVGVAALALGVALSRAWFEHWGWLAGPGTWALCALAVAALLRLPGVPVLAGAALSGLPSLAAVLLGVHWAGVPLAVAVFALWCGRLRVNRPRLRAAA